MASKLEVNFMNNVKDLLAKGDLKAARAFCQRVNSPISRVIEKGIRENTIGFNTQRTS